MIGKAMISRLTALFQGSPPGASGVASGVACGGKFDPADAELHLAAAALLTEAALMDGHADEDEVRTISALLMEQFGLSAPEAGELVAEGRQTAEQSGQLYAFTRVIKDRFSHEERVRMIEMLWEVTMADGEVDHFESNLIRRVTGLLYVSDRESGEARKRVSTRMELNKAS